ncbi:MAG: hypothetical protein AABX89_01625 [Candidatus Thermoplasmatota archaeon]
MRNTLLIVATAALLATATVQAATLGITSTAPTSGDYTMAVTTGDFSFAAVNATPVNKAGQGHIHYFLNGAPCENTCAGGASYATTDKSFTFKGLKAGDVVTAELVNNDHSSLATPVLQTQFIGAGLTVTSTAPASAGDYAMSVTVPGLKLSDVNLVNPKNAAGQGHIHYFLNGAPCADACAGGAVYASKSPSFTFKGLKAGDVVTAELVNNDHSSFATQQTVTQIVGGAILLTATPKAPEATLTVNVGQFGLVPVSATPTNAAGKGHLHFLLNGAACQDTTKCPGFYATDATSFVYTNLVEGDKIGVEVVNSDHTSLSPRIVMEQTVVKGAPTISTPGFELVALVAALGAALVVLRRKQ